MGFLIEGVGDDWVVTRRPDGKPELTTFGSLPEFRRAMTRLLLKYDQSEPALAPRPLPTIEAPATKEEISDTLGLGELPPGTNCQDCGACCGTMDPTKEIHVKLTKADLAQIPPALKSNLIEERHDGQFLKTKKNQDGDTVCSALSGSIGGRSKCGIYKQRPEVCRVFEPGSLECLLARKQRGM